MEEEVINEEEEVADGEEEVIDLDSDKAEETTDKYRPRPEIDDPDVSQSRLRTSSPNRRQGRFAQRSHRHR